MREHRKRVIRGRPESRIPAAFVRFSAVRGASRRERVEWRGTIRHFTFGGQGDHMASPIIVMGHKNPDNN